MIKAQIFKVHTGDLIQKLAEYENNSITKNVETKPYLVMSYVTLIAFEEVHKKANQSFIVSRENDFANGNTLVAKYGSYKILVDNDLAFGRIEIR